MTKIKMATLIVAALLMDKSRSEFDRTLSARSWILRYARLRIGRTGHPFVSATDDRLAIEKDLVFVCLVGVSNEYFKFQTLCSLFVGYQSGR